MAVGDTGRPNQRTRTRKDLLQAAARLMKQGRTPSLEDVAAEALVSRATAYRYFPSVEALLVEASFDLSVPEADSLFDGDTSTDPVARLQRVDTALHDMILANEAVAGLLAFLALKKLPRRPLARTRDRLKLDWMLTREDLQ